MTSSKRYCLLVTFGPQFTV